MSKVSVLVAVYNASQYLGKCLDSLMSQTLSDIQIVCVDDCSTDDSLSILNDYAVRDSRMVVIHLDENCGQAHARNAGLTVADGEYVCMLDADDWFSPDALEQAVAVFEEYKQTDSVLFDVVMTYADHSEMYPMADFVKLSGSEAFRLSLTWQIHGLYMVRASIHKKHPYDETCKLYSDDNTTRIHYAVSREVRHCHGKYYYRQHEQSATHIANVHRFDYLKANESMRRQMIELGTSQELIDEYENHRWLNVVDVCMFYHCHGRELSAKDRAYGLNEIRRVWQTIDRSALDPKITAKFGYRPMATWWQFRVQEWLYFTIRGLMGKNC